MNFFSTLANGCDGILWWCANEQTELMTAPYTWSMVENELGMRYADGSPKPVLHEMKRLSQVCKSLNFDLPPANTDAVCLLTLDQNHWGVAYMSYVLAKQAHMNISFADASSEIPDSPVYMMPSICGTSVLPKEKFIELKAKVAAGATLYISRDSGRLYGFEELTGNRMMDYEENGYADTIELNGKKIPFVVKSRWHLESIRAESVQTPLITRAAYGKGTVYFVNFPVEAMLIEGRRKFDNNVCEIYKELFRETIASHIVKIDNHNVALTIHEDGHTVYAVAVNHSEEPQKLQFDTACKLVKVHYGDVEKLMPMDAVIVEFER